MRAWLRRMFVPDAADARAHVAWWQWLAAVAPPRAPSPGAS